MGEMDVLGWPYNLLAIPGYFQVCKKADLIIILDVYCADGFMGVCLSPTSLGCVHEM